NSSPPKLQPLTSIGKAKAHHSRGRHLAAPATADVQSQAGSSALAAANVPSAAMAPELPTPVQNFQIFYSQGCSSSSAYHTYYDAVGTGESWINDRFEEPNPGTAGWEQTIRNNGASVLVRDEKVRVTSTFGGLTVTSDYDNGSENPVCFNFGAKERNSNTSFTVLAP
ncbi:hypothetical protein, partial [Subtercola sp. RTI3]|uniref:hypothetical protein n=1 Tax=Subtercola sp. RTI3 TaxID=3048639 RepID=UPI002B22EAA3